MSEKLTALFIILSLAPGAYGQSKASRKASEFNYAIAFASFAPLNTDIFVADVDGSNPRPLLPHPDLDYNASFSHDGKWIIFSSERRGSADIYRVHPDGSSLERLTRDPAFDDQGALSPDGNSLAFVSSRSGQADIWILTLATGRLRNLTDHPAGDFRSSWSPDGKWIAFASARGGFKDEAILHPYKPQPYGELYVMRADGSDARRLTDNQYEEATPGWIPVGQRQSKVR
jgi:Tol biopolymer transport system component